MHNKPLEEHYWKSKSKILSPSTIATLIVMILIIGTVGIVDRFLGTRSALLVLTSLYAAHCAAYARKRL